MPGTAQPLEIQIWHIDCFVLHARNSRKNDAVVDFPPGTVKTLVSDGLPEYRSSFASASR
jgi:hypothetical protein